MTSDDLQALTYQATSEELLALLVEFPEPSLACVVLQIAVENDARELAEAALAAGGDPNFQAHPDSFPFAGYTTLTWAHSPAMLQLLLESGGQVAMENGTSSSLHRAAERGDRESAALLLSYDGRLALTRFDYLDYTPLHWAIRRQHWDIVKLLLTAGADINAHHVENIGETPLSELVWQHGPSTDLELVEFLLRHGADPTIPGWMRDTAVDRAHELTGPDSKLTRLLKRSIPTAIPTRVPRVQ